MVPRQKLTVTWFGSREWANELLKRGIKELQNEKRARIGVFVEVNYYLWLLEEYGFWWQLARLRNWIHKYSSSFYAAVGGEAAAAAADPPSLKEVSP